MISISSLYDLIDVRHNSLDLRNELCGNDDVGFVLHKGMDY